MGTVVVGALLSGCILGRYEVEGKPATANRERVIGRKYKIEGVMVDDILKIEASEEQVVEVLQVVTTRSTIYASGRYSDESAIKDIAGSIILVGFVAKPIVAIRDGIRAMADDKAYIWGGPLGVLLCFLPGFWATEGMYSGEAGFDRGVNDRGLTLGTHESENVVGAGRVTRVSPHVGPMEIRCHGTSVQIQTDESGHAEIWVSRSFGIDGNRLGVEEKVSAIIDGNESRVAVRGK
jgi:hypothetical protein